VRFRLIPRDTAFYDLFAAAADNIVEGARLLQRLIEADPGDRAALAEQLRQVEHHGDEIVHDTLRRLNTTFVTPFDRADIYALTSALDDCIDQIEEGAALIVLYRVDPLPDGVRKQAELLTAQAELTTTAMRQLRSLSDLAPYWVEINRLENEADAVHRQMIGDLFEHTTDPIRLLKVKEIIENLEEAADAFEQVSHHVETIAVKES
jgi:predicted phosphate transport protein (TIGR00153 family)